MWKIKTSTGGKLLEHNLILEITESPSREAKPLNIPAHNSFSQYWVALIFLPLLNEEVTFGENICIEPLTRVGMFLSRVFLANLNHRVLFFSHTYSWWPDNCDLFSGRRTAPHPALLSRLGFV